MQGITGAVGGSASVGTQAAAAAMRAKIINTENPLDFVLFDLNPTDITISHRSSIQTDPNFAAPDPGAGVMNGALALLKGNTGTRFVRVDLTKLKMTALFDQDHAVLQDQLPGSVRRRCELLGAWTKPDGGSLLGTLVKLAVGGDEVNPHAKPPLLVFQWGHPFMGGFMLTGYLESVSTQYVRFDEFGHPTRAKAQLSFVEDPQSTLNALTNPTSGGLPGRKAHVVTEGENLQTIAMATYGRPGLWRKIADVNGIDDPMRVRVGSTVYLPGPSELG